MKKGAIVFGLTLSTLTYFLLKKKKEVEGIFHNITASLSKINDVKYESGNIKINLSIKLNNNTNFGTNITEYVTLKEVKLYNSKGNLLAVSNPEITGIAFLPNQSITIDNIEINGTLSSAVKEYISTQFKGKYKIEATIEALGNSWVLS